MTQSFASERDTYRVVETSQIYGALCERWIDGLKHFIGHNKNRLIRRRGWAMSRAVGLEAKSRTPRLVPISDDPISFDNNLTYLGRIDTIRYRFLEEVRDIEWRSVKLDGRTSLGLFFTPKIRRTPHRRQSGVSGYGNNSRADIGTDGSASICAVYSGE